MNKIASRLKSLRGSESQKYFASRFGVNQTTYSRWELGQTEPSLDMVMRICGVMRVSSDWLVGLSEERMPAAGAPGTGQGGEFARSEEVSSLRDEVRALRAAVERLGRK